ncbi:MAG: hypothetical protein ABIG61_07330 [Planctomycetota bacterium]
MSIDDLMQEDARLNAPPQPSGITALMEEDRTMQRPQIPQGGIDALMEEDRAMSAPAPPVQMQSPQAQPPPVQQQSMFQPQPLVSISRPTPGLLLTDEQRYAQEMDEIRRQQINAAPISTEDTTLPGPMPGKHYKIGGVIPTGLVTAEGYVDELNRLFRFGPDPLTNEQITAMRREVETTPASLPGEGVPSREYAVPDPLGLPEEESPFAKFGRGGEGAESTQYAEQMLSTMPLNEVASIKILTDVATKMDPYFTVNLAAFLDSDAAQEVLIGSQVLESYLQKHGTKEHKQAMATADVTELGIMVFWASDILKRLAIKKALRGTHVSIDGMGKVRQFEQLKELRQPSPQALTATIQKIPDSSLMKMIVADDSSMRAIIRNIGLNKQLKRINDLKAQGKSLTELAKTEKAIQNKLFTNLEIVAKKLAPTVLKGVSEQEMRHISGGPRGAHIISKTTPASKGGVTLQTGVKTPPEPKLTKYGTRVQQTLLEQPVYQTPEEALLIKPKPFSRAKGAAMTPGKEDFEELARVLQKAATTATPAAKNAIKAAVESNKVRKLVDEGYMTESMAAKLYKTAGKIYIERGYDMPRLRDVAPGKALTREPSATATAKVGVGVTPDIGTAAHKAKTFGRPGLANPMMTEDGRRLMDLTDDSLKMAGVPEAQSISQAKNVAKAKLTNPGYRATIENRMKAGEPFSNWEDQFAGKMVLNERMAVAYKSGDAAKIREVQDLQTGWRETGTDIGRQMRGRVDEVSSPGERLGILTREGLSEVPRGTRKKVATLRRSGRVKQAEELLNRHAERTQRVLDDWKKDGISLDDINKLDTIDDRTLFRITSDLGKLGEGQGGWSPIQEYYRNSLMSSPKTFIRNMLGGLYAAEDIYVTKPIARLLQGKNAETGAAIYAANSKIARTRAMSNMINSFRYEVPALETKLKVTGILKGQEIYGPPAITGRWIRKLADKTLGTKYGNMVENVVGKLGKKIRLPQRGAAGVDEYVKTIHVHSEVAAEAVTTGKKLGLKSGSKEMIAFVEEELANMTSGSWARAIKHKDTWRVTFQADAGNFEKAALGLRRLAPPVGLVMPFVKTPTQLAGQAAMHTPFGLPMIPIRALGHLMGKPYAARQLSLDVARQMIGAGTTALLWPHIGGDDTLITGPISYDKEYRDEANTRKEAAPPMTIKTPWGRVSYRNIDPLSLVIGTTVTVIEGVKEIMEGREPSKAYHQARSKIVSMYSDASWLRGAGDLIKMSQDPEVYSDRVLKDIVTGFVPNIASTAMRASDKNIRERRIMGTDKERPSFGEQFVREAFPTAALAPPPKVNVFGEDVEKYADSPTSRFIMELLLPAYLQKNPEDTKAKALEMLMNWNRKHHDDSANQFWIREPNRSIEIYQKEGDRKTTHEQMNENEYYLFAKLSGLMAGERIEEMVTNEEINVQNPKQGDINLLEAAFSAPQTAVKSLIIGARNAKSFGNNELYDELIESIKLSIKDYEQPGVTK